MATALPHRPRISDDFLAAHRRERLLDGLAHALAENGYRGTKVADIVRIAHVARNTFYETFGSKAEAAVALVERTFPGAASFTPSDMAGLPAALLAVEVAVKLRVDGPEEALAHALGAAQVLRAARDCEVAPLHQGGDDLKGTLPPGRHGLPAEYVAANQKARLLEGVAAAIAERGVLGTRLADVAAHAAVSRRTFYEHFSSVGEVARALIRATSSEAAGLFEEVDPRSALGPAIAEAVASEVHGVADRRTTLALNVLSGLASRLDAEEQVAA